MSQTRTGSFVESCANIAVGIGVGWIANVVILPFYSCAVSPQKALEISLLFTVISLVRSYILRRWFNGLRFGNTTEVYK